MSKTIALFTIILVEGYVVLASELLAMRQMIPFVGSGTETISIIIASVLMPLAFGYYAGGKYKPSRRKGKCTTIRSKLLKNIIIAGIFFTFGLSYVFLEIFFNILNSLELTNRIVQASIYSICFLVYPVFLLGQTVPLVSNFFSKHKLSRITGRMLFFSTTGSFLGSIVSTLVLMATIGVHNTVIFTVSLLAVLVFILSKKNKVFEIVAIMLITTTVYLLNNNDMMKTLNIVENNNYSTIEIIDIPEQKARIMRMNRSNSSKYADNFELMFDYLKYVEPRYIDPTLNNKERKSILVIGAGGFTLGLRDTQNEYIFVDIDKSLKRVSEEFLLQEELTSNKKFIPEPARAFLNRNKQKFDIIIIDAYSNVYDIPPQLITKEFFEQVKAALEDNGIVLFNAIVDPNFRTQYSIKIDNTLRSVFPHMSRASAQKFDGWNQKQPVNIIYTYHNNPQYTNEIYTDDLNTYYMDR